RSSGTGRKIGFTRNRASCSGASTLSKRPGTMQTGLVSDSDSDIIQPFQIEGVGVRGRLVRLSTVADEILKRHDYPDVVARQLAEMMALSAVLAAALKYDGIFTLQTK